MASKTKDSKRRGNGDGGLTERTYRNGTPYWYATWSFKDAEGITRRGSKNFPHDQKAEAQKHLRQVGSQVDAGKYHEPKKGTVEELFQLWMSGTVWGNLAPQTQRGYRRHIEQIIPRIGHLQLSALTGVHLDVMYAELLKSGNHAVCCKKHRPCGSHKGATGLSKSSVRHYHNTLCSALRYAVEAKLVPHAVTADAHPPTPSAAKKEKAKFSTWTGEEGGIFMGATRQDPLYPIWHLLLTTGCRRGEALGIKWDHLNLDLGLLSLQETVGVSEDEHGKREVIIQHSLKGDVEHMISLDPGTVAVLREHRKHWREDKLRFGERWTDKGLVFYRGMGGVRCQRPGEPLDGEWVSTQWRESVWRVSGGTRDPETGAYIYGDIIKRIRLHDTRHTWATLALLAGENVKVVQERLGHSHSSITQMLYQHTTPGMDAAAAVKVANMFG